MSVITKVLKKICVYWPKTNIDQYGKPVYGPAVELKCRWVDFAQEIITPDSTTVASKTEVMVSADVVPGGVLRYGTLAEVPDLLNPLKNPGAHEIIQFEKVPNFNHTEYVRSAYL